MALTNFVDGTTKVVSSWLNGVDVLWQTIFGGATTAAQARTALGVSATGADTTYNARANNLSDVANAATARTNLGLASGATTVVGTAATLNVGTAANNIVQLDGSAKLPAVDGSALTNIVASTVSSIGDWFEANKNGTNQGSILNAASTKITFTTEVVDTASIYDASNSRLVPGNGQRWFINAAVAVTGGADANILALQLYKNGALSKQSILQQPGGTATTGCNGTFIVEGNGTDYYEIYLNLSNSAGLTADGTTTKTWIQGIRVK